MRVGQARGLRVERQGEGRAPPEGLQVLDLQEENGRVGAHTQAVPSH